MNMGMILDTNLPFLLGKDKKTFPCLKPRTIASGVLIPHPSSLIPEYDLVLVPLGIILVLKMIPPAVLAECREKAEAAMDRGKPTSKIAAIVIVAIWLILGIFAVIWVGRILKR